MATKTKTKIELPQAFAYYIPRFVEAQAADLVAQAAEQDLHRRVKEGPAETQASVCNVFALTKDLKAEDIKYVEAFFIGQEYFAYDANGDQPDGIQKKVPFGKPAQENIAIPVAKLAMPNRDKSTLTKVSGIVGFAIAKGLTVDEFPEWLAGEHARANGEILGRGILAAYEAHCNGAAKGTANKASTTAAPAKSPTVDQTALREAQQKAFRFGKVQPSLKFNVPASIKGKGVFMLLVREDEHGVTSIVPLALDEQKALEAFNAVDRHFEQNPGDKTWDVSVSAKPAANRIAKAANTPTSRKKVA